MDDNLCIPNETTSIKTEKKESQISPVKTEDDDQQQLTTYQLTQEGGILEEQQRPSAEPQVFSALSSWDKPPTTSKPPKTPPPRDESEIVEDEEENNTPASAHEMLKEEAVLEIADDKLIDNKISFFSEIGKSLNDGDVKVEPEKEVTPCKDKQMDSTKLEPEVVTLKIEVGQEENDSVEINEEMEMKPEPVKERIQEEEPLIEPKKADDEGEIVSEYEDAVAESCFVNADKKKESRKRKRSKSGGENEEPCTKIANSTFENEKQSPRNRKTALEQLRSMKFSSKKDPFNDSREHRTYRFSRDISPIRNTRLQDVDTDKNRRSTVVDRRTPANKPHVRNLKNNEPANGENSLTEEQRRQRSTMFLLQNEQQMHQQNTQLPAILQKSAGVGPLKQRIENLLALPDDQVFNLPHQELKVLLIHAVELSQEQDRLLNGRKAQLIELDQMIKKEKDMIERISRDLPPQYRPNLSDELVLPKESPPSHGLYNAKSNGSSINNTNYQQVMPTKLPTDFSMPPPILNELTTPLVNTHHNYTSLPFQSHQPPPAGIPSDHSNVSSLPNMGMPPPMAQQSAPPAAMFSQPPPIIPSSIAAASTSSSSYSMATVTNTSVPPPTASFNSAPQVPVSMASNSFNPSQPPPNIPPLNFSVPPPSTQTDKSQQEKCHSTSNLHQFSVPPPQVKTSGHPALPTSFSMPPPSKPSIDVSIPPPTISLGVKPNVSATSVNLTQPPPSIQHQKPPPNFSQSMVGQNQAQMQNQHQLQQQMAMMQPDMTSVPPPNLALQLATAPLSLLGKQQGSSSNNQSGGNSNNANIGTATPPRPSGPPRPLMSIDQPPPPGLMERIAAGNGGLESLVPNQQAQPVQNKKVPTNSSNNRNQQRQQQHQQQKLRQARQQTQFNKSKNRNQSPAVVSGANAIPVEGLRRDKSPLVEGWMPSNRTQSTVSNAGSFSPLSATTANESYLTTATALHIQVQPKNETEDSQLQNISPVANE